MHWILVVVLAAMAACGPQARPAPAAASEPAPAEPEQPEAPEAPVAPSEPVTIVVVIEGHGLWIGNDSYVPEDEGAYPGFYKEVVAALDEFRGAGPAGSRIAVVTYGRGAQTRVELESTDEFYGDHIETQKYLADGEPYGHIQRDLVAGLDHGRALLAKAGGPRVLVVFGDGLDTNLDDGPAQLEALGKALANDGVVVYAVYAASALDGNPEGFDRLTSHVWAASSGDAFPDIVRHIVEKLGE